MITSKGFIALLALSTGLVGGSALAKAPAAAPSREAPAAHAPAGLPEATVYLHAAREYVGYALHEAVDEGDAGATLDQIRDARSWLDAAEVALGGALAPER